jgi:hypothetical protein
MEALHLTEIEDDPAIRRAEAGEAVGPAADGEVETRSPARTGRSVRQSAAELAWTTH